MIKVVEKIDTDRIQSGRNVGRFTETVLTGQDLEVRGFELYAHPEGYVALFLRRLPIVSADRRRWNLISALSRTSSFSVCSDPMLFDARRPMIGRGSSAWARVWK